MGNEVARIDTLGEPNYVDIAVNHFHTWRELLHSNEGLFKINQESFYFPGLIMKEGGVYGESLVTATSSFMFKSASHTQSVLYDRLSQADEILGAQYAITLMGLVDYFHNQRHFLQQRIISERSIINATRKCSLHSNHVLEEQLEDDFERAINLEEALTYVNKVLLPFN
jgi:hypothetical protein